MAEFHVVVEAVLDWRAGGELGVGPEAQDGRGEHVGAGMAEALQFGHFLPVIEGFAVLSFLVFVGHRLKVFNRR